MTRLLTVARAVLGVFGLLQPRRAAVLWGADPEEPTVVWAARVLGARHLAQAALLTARPTRGAAAVGAAVDLLHGSSMVLLAARSPRLRRPATVSACLAFAFAAATLGDRDGGSVLRGPARHRAQSLRPGRP